MALSKMQTVVVIVLAGLVANDEYIVNLPRATSRKNHFYISLIGSPFI